MRMAGFNSRCAATATHGNWPPGWLRLRRNLLKMPGNCKTMWTMWTTVWKGARLCGTLWNYVKRCETHKPIEISWHRAHCKAQTECHHKTLRFFIAIASVGAEATLRSSVERLSSGSGAKRWNIVSLSTEARFKSVACQRVYEFHLPFESFWVVVLLISQHWQGWNRCLTRPLQAWSRVIFATTYAKLHISCQLQKHVLFKYHWTAVSHWEWSWIHMNPLDICPCLTFQLDLSRLGSPSSSAAGQASLRQREARQKSPGSLMPEVKIPGK